ncbi:MAG: YqcC family protein [Pseudomonadales bacterium]
MNNVGPFAVDTLDFHQWLQFIFLPRMRDLIDTRSTLPMQSNITAMAEVVWADNLHHSHRAVLRQFDKPQQPSAR